MILKFGTAKIVIGIGKTKQALFFANIIVTWCPLDKMPVIGHFVENLAKPGKTCHYFSEIPANFSLTVASEVSMVTKVQTPLTYV